MRRADTALACMAALATAACSVAPRYTTPTMSIPVAYKEAAGWQPAGATVPPAGKWWTLFADPTLDALEERIEAGNPDLAAASARYAQAQAIASQARADLFPQISLGADAVRQRQSAGRPNSPGTSSTFSNVTLGASLDYELDLFGRVRNSVRAGRATAEADRKSVV